MADGVRALLTAVCVCVEAHFVGRPAAAARAIESEQRGEEKTLLGGQ